VSRGAIQLEASKLKRGGITARDWRGVYVLLRDDFLRISPLTLDTNPDSNPNPNPNPNPNWRIYKKKEEIGRGKPDELLALGDYQVEDILES